MKINHSFQINSLFKWALTEIESSVAGTTTLEREWVNACKG